MVCAALDPVRRLGRARGRNRIRNVIAVVISTALMVAACGGGTAGQNQSGDSGQTLTIGAIASPNSMDPAKINPSVMWFVSLAYDSLIYRTPDGTLVPRLAESWRYLGTNNTEFELKLRPGVKFSDGSPLTADVVKKFLEYFRKTGGPSSPYVTTFSSVDVADPLTVHLRLASPNPILPAIFTQDYLAGAVISGQALDSPADLATQTFGAGPYVLDPDETVTNDHYTYVPNPNYGDKSALHYRKVVIRVLPNPNTALSALKTGQVNVIRGDYSTADAASAAGMQVKSTPLNIVGLGLADRAGTLVPALGDVRVRQALNYAVDRERIIKGLYGDRGVPTEQIALAGRDGYNDTNFYTYDPEKARQLLASAGYPNGFTMSVLSTSYQSFNLVTQAVVDDLAKVGVKVELTNEAELTNYVKSLTSGKFAAYTMGYGTGAIYSMGPSLFLPSASVFNPLKSTDPQLESLFAQAAAAPDNIRGDLDKQMVRRLVELAWFVPVGFAPVFYFTRNDVAGVEATAAEPIASPTEWRPAGS